MSRNNATRNTKSSTYQPYSTIPIQLPYNSAWGLVDLTTDVTGILPVLNGGTGVALSTGTIKTVLNTSPTFDTSLNMSTGGVFQYNALNLIKIDATKTSQFWGTAVAHAGLTAPAADVLGIGNTALQSITTGLRNVAIGSNALKLNTSGQANVAVGYNALASNTTANSNMAMGDSALSSNTTGVSNAAIGGQSLRSNSTGSDNLAFGFAALQNNQTGGSNTAYGSSALIQNVQGSNNVGIGREALQGTLYTNENVGIGRNALRVMAAGSAGATVATAHVAIGYQAGIAVSTGTNTVLIGHSVAPNLTTGSNNTVIGKSSGGGITTGANNTIIGANVTGLSNPSNNIVIADGAGNQRIVGNSTGQILIPYKATNTDTSTTVTFTSANYGQKFYWSPTGTATGTLPANGAAVGSWFEVILLTDQDTTIQTVGATGTMTTGGTTVAKSVGFVTATQRIGSCVRFESNGTIWIAINLGSTTMTVTT